MDTCNACNKECSGKNTADKTLWLNCETCQKWYHIECERIKQEQYEVIESMKENVTWECNKCLKDHKKGRKGNKKIEETQLSQKLDEVIILLSGKMEVITTEIKTIKAGLTKQIEVAVNDTVQRELKQMREVNNAVQEKIDNLEKQHATQNGDRVLRELQQMKESTKEVSDKTDKLEKQLNEARNDHIPPNTERENTELGKLRDRLDALEREMGRERGNNGHPDYPWLVRREVEKNMQEINRKEDRRNNLIMFGLPEEEIVNTGEMGTWLSEKLGITVATEEITKLRRIGEGTARRNTPRPIQFGCLNRAVKDTILKNAKSLRLQEHTRKVYINPDRTYQQRQMWRSTNREWRPTASAAGHGRDISKSTAETPGETKQSEKPGNRPQPPKDIIQ